MSTEQNVMTQLHAIQNQQASLTNLLEKWVNINSGSDNIEGLNQMLSALEESFGIFGCQIERVPMPSRQKIDYQGNLIQCPVGNALQIIQRPHLERRVFLGGHMDTVYPKDSPFQKAERIAQNKLRGPGTADMKGGLLVMLKALEMFESSPEAKQIGWNVLIDADEEVGSTSSEELILQSASQCQIGLIFEPSYSDGNLVSSRKGSANYSIVARGRASHVGRDFSLGRNAITALARVALAAEALNNRSGAIVNIGSISGGGPVNIVPDLAICRINIRSDQVEEQALLDKKLKDIVAEANHFEGIELIIHEDAFRTPKPFNLGTEKLFDTLKICADQLSMPLSWRPSGGVCDGNILALAGVPCIDSLGIVGGNIHTHDEYAELDSLPQRAMLTALMLKHFAEHG